MSDAGKIRYLRESLGLRRTEFGLKIGCTYRQVERMEEDPVPISEELRRKICSEYGVGDEWFCEGSEDLKLEENSELRRKRLKEILEKVG